MLWKSRSLERPLRPEDLRITDRQYGLTLALRKCRNCGFIFADAKDVDELSFLYEKLVDTDYERTRQPRMLQMEWLLRQIRGQHPDARTLLDIGAGLGMLVARAQQMGLQATGVEPSTFLVAGAKRLYGQELVQGTFPHVSLAGRQFDVICVVDVLEHVRDPLGLLRSCAAALAPRGIVVLVTPDVGSMLARMLGTRWWHFRMAHVGYFHHGSLGLAMRRAGLGHLRWRRAKWFFPVDYLAERVAQYLPLSRFNKFARSWSPLAWAYRRIVPLDLRDSWFVLGSHCDNGTIPHAG